MNLMRTSCLLLFLIIIYSIFYKKKEFFNESNQLKNNFMPKYLQDNDKKTNRFLRPIKSNQVMDEFHFYSDVIDYSNDKCDENKNKDCNTKINDNSVFIDNNFGIWKPNDNQYKYSYLGETL